MVEGVRCHARYTNIATQSRVPCVSSPLDLVIAEVEAWALFFAALGLGCVGDMRCGTGGAKRW